MDAAELSSQIAAARSDPRRLEDLYRQAAGQGQSERFAAEIAGLHAAEPADPLLAAWFYRLAARPAPVAAGQTVAAGGSWGLAVVVGLALAAYFFWASDFLIGPNMRNTDKWVALSVLVTSASVSATAVIVFISLVSRRFRDAVPVLACLAAVTLAVIWIMRGADSNGQYVVVAALHMPVLAWVAAGLYLMRWRRDAEGRFAYLRKSVELAVTAGILGGTAGIVVMLGIGLFSAIGIQPDSTTMRLLMSLVGGVVPMLAAATVYDPRVTPAEQKMDSGLGWLVGLAGRIALPATLLVGALYIAFIPGSFWVPFQQRDVLIIYNAMLFAVMALLVVATPVSDAVEPGQRWLRRGLMLLALMAVLVSLYALAAAGYRTYLGGLTLNRLMILGWNVINIALLCVYLWRQRRVGLTGWLASAHGVFGLGFEAYALWSLFLVLVTRFLFPG